MGPGKASTPEEYVEALDGWRADCVRELRTAVRGCAGLEEVVKWGHLVYLSNGPVLLIRAEDERVLFGFWRGQRLMTLEPRLKAGGKYEMATLAIREGEALSPEVARTLARKAMELNERLGDPRRDARAAGKEAT